MNLIFILMLFLFKTEATLKLIFNDEFNENDSIDQNKWEVEHEKGSCNGNNINQLNCKTNDKANLRIINGTLALAAIRQKHLDKFYTSPRITTKQMFTSGIFKIRMALPKGKMLRPIVYLAPSTNYFSVWPKDGEINIMSNAQDRQLINGIHFKDGEIKKDLGVTNDINENLNDLQNYVLEWSPTQFKWIFNERVLNTINITKELENKYNPFTKPFKLRISLGIGGYVGNFEFFPGQTLYEKDAENWECSLLMIDYIRVYQNVAEKVTNPDLPEPNKVTSSNICSQVTPLIRPKKPIWKLILKDEFNGNESINVKEWEVKHDQDRCEENEDKGLNCNSNSTRNVRLTDGSLVLAAIQEKYLEKNYTSPLIKTKRSFRYGKFEVRAALPEGKMLRPYIYLEPTAEWDRNVKIEILSNKQSKEFYFGIYQDKKEMVSGVSNRSLITDSLFNFHTYAIEWTETEIRWMFDNKPLNTTSIQKVFEKNIFDKSFKLVISLGVGGTAFPKAESLTTTDAANWPCSLFILDYVRVYEMCNEINCKVDYPDQNKTTVEFNRNSICKIIMKEFQTEFKQGLSSNQLIWIILVPVILVLFALISFNMLLYIRFKNSRPSSLDNDLNRLPSQKENIYGDSNIYDEIELNNTYDIPNDLYDSIGNEYYRDEFLDRSREIYQDRYLVMNRKSEFEGTYC